MSPKLVIESLFKELGVVAAHGPNERLPKEEQSRCCLYAYLKPMWDVVCVERGYSSIDEGGKRECDLFARASGRPDLWLELKHGRCARGWQNKPSEERNKWEDDLDKLRFVSTDSDRYFLLVCFTDFDPSVKDLPRRGQVIQIIRSFHSEQLVIRSRRLSSGDWMTGSRTWALGYGTGGTESQLATARSKASILRVPDP